MIRVLVVDDSPLVRRIATDILNKQVGISVVATAPNAEIAVNKIPRFKPDVVTMDIEMPGMGGLAAIKQIMSTEPIPIIVLSAFATRGAEMTMQALEYGALDFIPKPTSSLSGGIDNIEKQLVEKVRHASRIEVTRREHVEPEPVVERRVKAAPPRRNRSSAFEPYEVVAIGTSTGGPVALRRVLQDLPANMNAGIVVVQHMPPVFTKAFAARLDSLCSLEVKEAVDGDAILPGRVLIAPGNYHMVVSESSKHPSVSLHQWEPVSGHRPSVDVLMYSVARRYGSKAIAVIMTGMGKDGAEGIAELKRERGYVIAQDKPSSVIFGMNGEVIKNGDADDVLPLQSIADGIINLCMAPEYV